MLLDEMITHFNMVSEHTYIKRSWNHFFSTCLAHEKKSNRADEGACWKYNHIIRNVLSLTTYAFRLDDHIFQAQLFHLQKKVKDVASVRRMHMVERGNAPCPKERVIILSANCLQKKRRESTCEINASRCIWWCTWLSMLK